MVDGPNDTRYCKRKKVFSVEYVWRCVRFGRLQKGKKRLNSKNLEAHISNFDSDQTTILKLARQGSPIDLVTCQCTNLMQMKHYIKTGCGVSKKPIKALPGQSLEGSGQGDGSSVGNWQGHNDAMITTFEQLCQPCTLTSSSGLDTLLQWMMIFIDDNKITMNFKVLTGVQRIYESIQHGVQCWCDILCLTGGELELEKVSLAS